MKTKQIEYNMGRRKDESAKTKSGKWLLFLYVAGQTSKTTAAFNNLKTIKG